MAFSAIGLCSAAGTRGNAVHEWKLCDHRYYALRAGSYLLELVGQITMVSRKGTGKSSISNSHPGTGITRRKQCERRRNTTAIRSSAQTARTRTL